MARQVDVAVIGAGSAGLYAVSQIRKKTDNFVLIDGGPLGTTCARVGCMPSKAAIHIAEHFHHRHELAQMGISGGEKLAIAPDRAWQRVRELRDFFVERTKANSTDKLTDKLIRGQARFRDANTLEVEGELIRADKIVIATGSRPLVPKAWQHLDEHLLTTDNLFELTELPRSLAVIGLGVIGLELGQALARMGIEVTGFERTRNLGGLEDAAVAEKAAQLMQQEFPIHLGHAAELEEEDGRVQVTAGDKRMLVDKVLVSIGREPNVENLGLENLGVPLEDNGLPAVDPHTLQVGELPVFIAGDVTAERMVLHEAADDGRIAGYNAVAEQVTAFKRKTPLGITFTDPNICSVGATLAQLDENDVVIGELTPIMNGRAKVLNRNPGIIRIYGDKRTGRLLGASMLTVHGEHLAHQLAWAIQQEQTVFDLIRMPFYHPVLQEALQNALYDLAGKVEEKPQGPLELERC